MKYPKNFGLDYALEQETRITDYSMVGANSDKIGAREVLQEDGHGWLGFLTEVEYQRSVIFDSMSCVTFSAWNCIETIVKRKYGEDINKSDRFTSKMSGTTKNGNGLWNVASSIRNNFSVNEEEWGWDRQDFNFSWDEYFSDIPEYLINKAEDDGQEYEIKYEWVPQPGPGPTTVGVGTLMFALQFSPLQVTVRAWGKPNAKGIYPRTTLRPNHAVMLFDYVEGEYFLIYDHYDSTIKKLAWDFFFGVALRYDVTKVDNRDMTLVNKYKGKYVMRSEVSKGAHGEMYYIDNNGKIIYLDSKRDAKGNIALVNHLLINVMKKQGLWNTINEDIYNKIK